MRLDQCLADLLPEYSRSKLQNWIKNGQVTVNQAVLKTRHKVQGGELVALNVAAEAVLQCKAEPIPLAIVHEDESLLVVNKPAGLVVHPAIGNWTGTLVNALLNHDARLADLARAGIVHRLDKDTSGLLMVAKTLAAQQCLAAQLHKRTITREYLALVKGWVTAGGTVDAPLARHPTDRTRYTVAAGGKHAITHYRLERRFNQHTLLRVKLETGRTHQIRVHMAHIHYPLVGDRAYAGRSQLPSQCSQRLQQALRGFSRQALHATRLGLQHPASKQYCEWEIAPPEDFKALLELLADEALD